MARTRTLKRQLIAWLAGPLVTLWLVSTVVDYDIANRFVNLAYDRTLLEVALDIGRNVKIQNEQIYIDLPKAALDMLQSREQSRIYYLVTGPNREFISGDPDIPIFDDGRTAERAERISYYDDMLRGRPIRAVALRVPVQPKSGKGSVLIQVAERVNVRTEFAGLIMLRIVLPQAILIILAGVLVWYAVGRGLAPLSSLRSEIESRSHRDLSPLPEEQAPHEVKPLIRAINDLLQRLSKALAAEQRFIADAAHQLRTPVAGIKTQTELALRQTPSGEARETLHQLHKATEQTIRLINQLLLLARAEPGAEHAHAMERTDLNAVVRESTAEWVPRALARNIDLGFDSLHDKVMIEGNVFLLREMLANLLDNAIRYTQPGGHVTVRVAADAANVELTVEDNGPGIAESDRGRVFERFYRVLGSGTEGCGLGLAIVREIALGHNAQITLENGAGGTGTLVRIRFPAAVPA
jgi:two-component system, OmpR family, sensor histidine kinase TctE